MSFDTSSLRSSSKRAADSGESTASGVRRACAGAVSGLAGSPATLAFRSKDVAAAVLKTLNEMRQDGAYDRLMDKWGAAKMPAGPLELKGPDMP